MDYDTHTDWERNIGWVMDSAQTHSELAVLLAIMIHPGGVAPTRDLAARAKVSRKTVMRAVRKFEGRGVLTVQRVVGEASYYTPNIPEVSA
ncbi:MAG: hypothetical protein COA38_20460 [Fluviicola sp.]|nr:MAG: hypothetical protein COA38_20460 [Fluviicola sp.]